MLTATLKRPSTLAKYDDSGGNASRKRNLLQHAISAFDQKVARLPVVAFARSDKQQRGGNPEADNDGENDAREEQPDAARIRAQTDMH